MHENLKRMIREIPDFPKEGILFRDITPILLAPAAFQEVCDALVQRYQSRSIEKIAAIESRGFIFGAVLASRLGRGLIPLRKPGKLPWCTIRETYALEYGEAALEMHVDAVKPGDRVVICDDLLATGGTAAAAVQLIERSGGIVDELAFVVVLSGLRGTERLRNRSVFTILSF